MTYFFNCGVEKPYEGEKDEIEASKKVETYDLAPAMSSFEVTEKVLAAIGEGSRFIVINYANGDMVGHTGVWEAVVKACGVVDECLGKVLAAASQAGYRAILTADHGNCDVMVNEETGEPHKEHTTNPVHFVYFDFPAKPYNFSSIGTQESKQKYLEYAAREPIGVLADIAPSVLALLGIPQPEDMGGMNIIKSLEIDLRADKESREQE